jgi:hypothetical protein
MCSRSFNCSLIIYLIDAKRMNSDAVEGEVKIIALDKTGVVFSGVS